VASEESRVLGGQLIGSTPADPAYADLLFKERATSALGRTVIGQIQTRFYDPVVTSGTRSVASDLTSGRLAILIAAAAAFLVFLGVGAVMVRRVWYEGRIAAQDARVRAVEARQVDIETRLQRALEMESTEEGTFDVIRQGLQTVAGGRAVELLVADSPQAHFHQVLSTSAPASAPVGSPRPASVPRRAVVRPDSSTTAPSSTRAHTFATTANESGRAASR
jgi:hypothetical protein